MRNATVALTDRRWFDFHRSRSRGGRIDEVNFWRPLAQTEFRALLPGEPFFFRLKSPINAVAGYGFFATFSRLPIRDAWETFKEANGDPNFEGLVARIAGYRSQTPAQVLVDRRELACVILREVRILEEREWVPWGLEREWSRNNVTYKTYDLNHGAGRVLAGIIGAPQPSDLVAAYQPTFVDERSYSEGVYAVREGQGTFRVRVLDAYGRRCAVTGERSIPVLDAAHIQPYLGPASNHIQNGLTLRADLHRLFDAGYVTVTPDYEFKVSDRLNDEYANGRIYYELQDRRLMVLPDDPSSRPSRQALDWHASHVYR
jgi:putative restriction endonuclease